MQQKPDYSKSEQYTLSIRLAPGGFSFYLVDPVNEGAALYESFLLPKNQPVVNAIEEVVYKNEHLLLSYKKTELVVVSPFYTIVPAAFSNIETGERLLSFTHENATGKYFVNDFRKKEMVNHFAVNEDSYNFLTRTFALSKVIHYMTPMLEYFTERSRFGNYSKMYANLESDRIDLFCFHRNQLELVNSYACQNLNDAIYYTLYTWEKLGLHQVNDELHICGDAGLRSRMTPHLSKYIQRVLPLNPPTSWYVAPADNKPLPLDLKTLSLCV
ncbi:DUF3822 family protein [Parabacteroides sp. FAFU027]|uniref:DUF3822 family protein n=1 Tax=Parabacteroides sp. FAFU027 TaxID=2922715 RepID=UPI001FAFF589|nr:DUF3822 family protein [Parabacteroides sp. FAFU027]